MSGATGLVYCLGMETEPTIEPDSPPDDAAIRTVVTRLARPHRSGGDVIERAAMLAEGGDFPAILKWITAHDGEAEVLAPKSSGAGLHGTRLQDGAGDAARTPLRYVLPAGAL